MTELMSPFEEKGRDAYFMLWKVCLSVMYLLHWPVPLTYFALPCGNGIGKPAEENSDTQAIGYFYEL